MSKDEIVALLAIQMDINAALAKAIEGLREKDDTTHIAGMTTYIAKQTTLLVELSAATLSND